MPSRLAKLFATALVLVLGAVSAADAASLHFTPPVALPDSLPSTDSNNPQRQGGEPSITFDPGGQLAFAASPGAPDNGGNFWRSTDGGKTFQPGISVGGALSGVLVESATVATAFLVAAGVAAGAALVAWMRLSSLRP